MFIPIKMVTDGFVIINVSAIELVQCIDGNWCLSVGDFTYSITEKSMANVLRAMQAINVQYGHEFNDLLRSVGPSKSLA